MWVGCPQWGWWQAALFEWLCAFAASWWGESWLETQLLVMVAASCLSGIPLGRQTPSKENKVDDQLRLLWASFRSRSAVWWRMRDVVWKEGGTASSEGQSRRGRAGGWERKDPSPPLAVAPQCVCEVFCKKFHSVQLCPVCLEVRRKPPLVCITCFLLWLEAAKLLPRPKFVAALKWSTWRDHLERSHKSPQQYSISQIYFFWWLRFQWGVGIWWAGSFMIFLNGFMAAFPIWEYVCAHVYVRINENVSMMISRYKWNDTFHMLSNHMRKKKKWKSLLLALPCVFCFCWFTSALGPHGQFPAVTCLFRQPLLNIHVLIKQELGNEIN